MQLPSHSSDFIKNATKPTTKGHPLDRGGRECGVWCAPSRIWGLTRVCGYAASVARLPARASARPASIAADVQASAGASTRRSHSEYRTFDEKHDCTQSPEEHGGLHEEEGQARAGWRGPGSRHGGTPVSRTRKRRRETLAATKLQRCTTRCPGMPRHTQSMTRLSPANIAQPHPPAPCIASSPTLL